MLPVFHHKLGRLAQRLAHFVHTEGVVGSIPTSPTRYHARQSMMTGIFYICRATVPHMASGLGWHLAVSGFDHEWRPAVVQSRCARCRLGCNTGALNRP